ncbi:type II glyceraldehyde-3-phosphate dehydrogenase [Sulfuracidifex tepidarius]|uniref:Glyceraldehyde-3-phosphate dehydrogenase n=1 Tax=Sulfuracidifex tepidarius TaxID=1294262 RepID=A0A510DU48_9CREN|nr:type II glyceraldehyde-3-phosphate dehydrogenase [Sulfuracidifex tepidarius]BBG23753.1 Glyceraldehyde-3-phosphate dehydrogenase [Sulfuracidifex tepidarius]BBG26506.1 Glyceraldehyde-3-phosphate dehydrogenase [Sulfuracidifex tepidarius]
MIKVSINGYGTIGKRVADAVLKQPDMELVGVAKTSPNYEAMVAFKRNMRIYVPEENKEKFISAGIEPAGNISDMIEESDVIVDATPNGVGAEYKKIYVEKGKPALFQGGEKSNVGEISFSALCNYDEAIGKKYVRVVSCNTTAMLRTICTTSKVSPVKKVRGTVIRRAADPKEYKKGPINALVPDPASVPSHHAKDVNTVLKDLDIVTMAVISPTNLMHVHLLDMETEREVRREEILEQLLSTPRIVVVPGKAGINSTAELVELARDLGRERNDMPEVMVFEDSVQTKGKEVFLMYAVHQESIVVPENVDAVRAVSGMSKSIDLTNASLGIRKGYII